MVGDRAIRVGGKLPAGYNKVGTSVCPTCRASFSVVHPQQFADGQRAAQQVTDLQDVLRGEHVDSKFGDHLPSYEDLDG